MPLLLYDEKCSVCRRFVSLAVNRDRSGAIRIAPLQGPHGEELRRAHPAHATMNSALYLEREGAVPLERSDAILAVAVVSGPPWRVAAATARLIPRPLRDWAYRTFAGNRKYFGWMGLEQLDERSRARLL